MSTSLTPALLKRWRLAIFVIFTLSGLSIATWASRVPAIKAALEIENSQIGLLLLGAGIASVAGVSFSPAVRSLLGPRRGMLTSMLIYAVGVAVVGVGTNVLQSYPVTVIGLALFGLGNGMVDVMMNVDAAVIEKRSGKTLLPLFHGFFSLGTVIGASVGALAAFLHVSVLAHTATIAVLIAVAGAISVTHVPAQHSTPAPAAPAPMTAPSLNTGPLQTVPVSRRHTGMRDHLTVWREPRTYALGVILFGVAFSEGGANDWLALSIVEEHHGTPAQGAVALAIFAACITALRVLGGPVVDRFGRVCTLQVLAVLSIIGILLVILSPTLPPVLVGAALWGLGSSLGFPLGISAAADDPVRSAARVSAVTTIGYVGILCGPPVLGVISDHWGLLNTMYVVVALVVASGIASVAARPPHASGPESH